MFTLCMSYRFMFLRCETGIFTFTRFERGPSVRTSPIFVLGLFWVVVGWSMALEWVLGCWVELLVLVCILTGDWFFCRPVDRPLLRSTGQDGRPEFSESTGWGGRPVVEVVDRSVFQRGKLVTNLLLHYIYTHITSSSSFLTPRSVDKPHSSPSSPPTLFLRSPVTG